MLYLENNLTAHVFTPARVAVSSCSRRRRRSHWRTLVFTAISQEREAKIRRLVDSNIIGIFVWDLDGQIIEANDAFLRIVGYEREDLVSGRLRWRSLTPPEWREPTIDVWPT